MIKRLRAVTVATVVLAVGLTVLAAVAIESPQERAQVRAANQVSDRFDRSLRAFVAENAASVATQLGKEKADYRSLAKYVDARIELAPKIGTSGTTAYGRQHSKDYRNADQRRTLALKPFRGLSAYLKNTAIPGQAFVDAGKDLVRVNPAKILADIAIYSGAPLRDRVVPAFEKARDRLKKQKTPEDSQLLRLDLETYASDAISQTKSGAKKIDAHQPFVFNFGTRPNELLSRLVGVETTIATMVGSGVDVLRPAS